MNGLAGAVVWAVVPFAPEAPFALYAGSRHAPVEVPQADKLIAAARRGADAEFTFLVPGKARPVLIVSDQLDPRLGELLALRLLRLTKLDAREQDAVRAGAEPGLFHFPPDRFDLPEENAGMIAALVRVHRSAIDSSPVGHLDRDELRSVHGRIARHYGLDLHDLIRDELRRLAAVQRERRA
ncbi:MAG: hypothetical protein ACRDL0_01640 [Thermoleophilaceae bacterium]